MRDLFSGIHPSIDINFYGKRRLLVANAGLHWPGNQLPYISVTAEVSRPNGYVEAAGCQHDLVAEHFPELRPLIPFHLCSWDGKQCIPMHYIANAIYWWEFIHGTSRFSRRSYDPDPIEAFKSTVVYGVCPSDTDEFWKIEDADELRARLQARLPELSTACAKVLGDLGIAIPEAWFPWVVVDMWEKNEDNTFKIVHRAFDHDSAADWIGALPNEDDVSQGRYGLDGPEEEAWTA